MTAPGGGAAPEKLHYRLSEVCELTDTQPYVLRFWEQEFPQLASEKSRAGQRLYRKEDIELVRKIKHLLYDREFTIADARAAIDGGDAANSGAAPRGASAKRGAAAAAAPRPREISADLEGLLFEQSEPAAGDTAASERIRALERALAAARASLAAASEEREKALSDMAAEVAKARFDAEHAGETIRKLRARHDALRGEVRRALAELQGDQG